MTRPRLVLDTNTVLALWHFADPGLAPLAAAISGKAFILASRSDALEELRFVLARPCFGIAPEAQAQIFASYCDALVPVPVPTEAPFDLPVCRDRADQKFLEIARDCGAGHLLTRDKLLLRLNRHRLLRERFRIMTPERFLAEYVVSGTPVAITRHGQTVVPAQGQGGAELAVLKQASKTLDELLARREVDTEAVVADFKKARRQGQSK